VARLLEVEPYRPDPEAVRAEQAERAWKKGPGGRWLAAFDRYYRGVLSLRAEGGVDEALGRLP
jgi:hypothetical protein